jgi:CRISPR-associated protein Csb1
MTPEKLVDRITQAVALTSTDAGIRIGATLQPAAGPSGKVYPPTYAAESPYVMEDRFRDGKTIKTVLLDAQQSQANRAEEALSQAIEDGVLLLPHLRLEGNVEGWPILVTNLTAPHRGPDAYFRDAEDDAGLVFDKTKVGESLRRADATHATAFFESVPSDLCFGFWDSQRGGRGVKIPRCYTSEMFGWDPQLGMRAAGKVDPNNIEITTVAWPKKQPGEYEVIGTEGKVPKDFASGNPSKVGHGNIPPSIQKNGGVTVSGAERLAYLSFASLNRLRFPAAGSPTSTSQRDNAARTVLACLALYADRLAFNRPTILLRSGCELVVTKEQLQWLGANGETTDFTLSAADAKAALDLAAKKAASEGLMWNPEPVRLRPQKRLHDLLAATFTKYAEIDE